MLQVFKRDNISAYIVLLLIAFACKLKFLMHPSLIKPDPASFTAFFFNINRLKTVFTASPSLYVFLSVIVQFCFAIYLNDVVIRQKLYAQKNHFTALCFILITSFLPGFNFFSTAWVANIFLFIAFSTLMQLSQATQPRKSCFNIGVLLSIAVFFYFPLILFVAVFIFMIWLIRPFVLQELVACLLGFAAPFYFALALLYLNGKLRHSISSLDYHLQIPVQMSRTLPVILFLAVCILLFVYSLYIANKNAFKNAVLIRKKWRFVYFYLLFALLCAGFSRHFPNIYLIVALTPFSILLSQSFHNRKEKWNIFTFFFLIVSLFCVQWIFLK